MPGDYRPVALVPILRGSVGAERAIMQARYRAPRCLGQCGQMAPPGVSTPGGVGDHALRLRAALPAVSDRGRSVGARSWRCARRCGGSRRLGGPRAVVGKHVLYPIDGRLRHVGGDGGIDRRVGQQRRHLCGGQTGQGFAAWLRVVGKDAVTAADLVDRGVGDRGELVLAEVGKRPRSSARLV